MRDLLLDGGGLAVGGRHDQAALRPRATRRAHPVSRLAGIPLLLLEIVAALPKGASAPPPVTSTSSARLAPSFRCSSPRPSACCLRRGDQPVLQFQASATRDTGGPRPFAIFAALRRAFEFVLGLVLAIFALLPGSALLRRHRLDPASARAGGVQTRGSCESTYAGFRCRARAAPHACTRSP